MNKLINSTFYCNITKGGYNLSDFKVYGYCRVSSDEQADYGYSIGGQVTDVKALAFDNDLALADEDIFIDEGYSASNLRRPAVQKMIHIIASDFEPKVLFLRHPNRLTRNLVHKRSLQAVFEKYNVFVICKDNEWYGDNEDNNTISDFTMLLDENERKRIPKRVFDGLRSSAELGNYTVGGKGVIPGYKKVFNEKVGKGKYLVPITEYKDTVIKIFEVIASRDTSIEYFANYLNKNKIMDMRWSWMKLKNMISNPIYYGRFKTNYCDIENHTEPIVSKHLWEEANKALNIRHRYRKNTYLFKNRLYCKECDCVLSCDCTHKKKENKLYKYYKCPICGRRISEKDIIHSFLIYFKFTDDNNYIYRQQVDSLNKKINNIEMRIKHIEDLYDENLIDYEEYDKKIKGMYVSIRAHKKEMRRIIMSNSKEWNSLTEKQQRLLVVKYVHKGIVWMDSKQVKFNFINCKKKV